LSLTLSYRAPKKIRQIFEKMVILRLPPPLCYLAKSSFTIIARPYKYTQALANVCYITCSQDDEPWAPHEWYWAWFGQQGSCCADGEGSDNGGSGSDADCFLTISLEGPNDAGEASKDSGPAGFEAVGEIELGFGGSSEGLELRLGQIAECDDVDAADSPKPLNGRSIAHNVLTDGSAVFLSFDIEIGGEYVGIIQLSSELVWMKFVAGQGVAQDHLEEVARVDTFDSYVKSDCNIWDQRCIDIHQIHPDDESIVSAHNIDHVLGQFKTWLNRHVGISETIILVAWNMKTCDLKWLWKFMQAPWSRLSFPPQIQFFIDLYQVITGFMSCPLHKSKSKLKGYDLGSVWKYRIDRGLSTTGV
jgi:hypothetical protein